MLNHRAPFNRVSGCIRLASHQLADNSRGLAKLPFASIALRYQIANGAASFWVDGHYRRNLYSADLGGPNYSRVIQTRSQCGPARPRLIAQTRDKAGVLFLETTRGKATETAEAF